MNYLEYKHHKRFHRKNSQNQGYYIWKTRGDERVRSRHRRLHNKVFSWDDIPPGGKHPGEDFNCRCKAVPISNEEAYRRLGKPQEVVNEFVEQTLISSFNDSSYKWSLAHFVDYYFNGAGISFRLSKTGYSSDVERFYANKAIASDGKSGVYRAINIQIINKAKTVKAGPLSYNFRKSYEFGSVTYALAESLVEGDFEGEVVNNGSHLAINGVITYNFVDNFDDPFQMIEIVTSLPKVDRSDAIYLIRDYMGIDTEFAGSSYKMYESWQTKFSAVVKVN